MADASNGPELVWSLACRGGRWIRDRKGAVGFAAIALFAGVGIVMKASEVISPPKVEAAVDAANRTTPHVRVADGSGTKIATVTDYLPEEVFVFNAKRWIRRTRAYPSRREEIVFEVRNGKAFPARQTYYSNRVASFPDWDGPVDELGEKHGEWKRYTYVDDRIATELSWWFHGEQMDRSEWMKRSN